MYDKIHYKLKKKIKKKNKYIFLKILDFPGVTVNKNSPANVRDVSLIPGLGRFHMPQSN